MRREAKTPGTQHVADARQSSSFLDSHLQGFATADAHDGVSPIEPSMVGRYSRAARAYAYAWMLKLPMQRPHTRKGRRCVPVGRCKLKLLKLATAWFAKLRQKCTLQILTWCARPGACYSAAMRVRVRLPELGRGVTATRLECVALMLHDHPYLCLLHAEYIPLGPDHDHNNKMIIEGAEGLRASPAEPQSACQQSSSAVHTVCASHANAPSRSRPCRHHARTPTHSISSLTAACADASSSCNDQHT